MPPITTFFRKSRPTKYSDFDAPTRNKTTESRVCSNASPPLSPLFSVSTAVPSTKINVSTTTNGDPSSSPSVFTSPTRQNERAVSPKLPSAPTRCNEQAVSPKLPSEAMVTPTLANTPTISTSYVARDNNFQLPTLLVANVRSIINKIDELELVAQINQVEVICITESWLNTSVVDSMISLSNFIQFRNDRTYSCGGGVCIYIKEEIYCRRLEHFEDPAIESLWLLLRPKRLPRSISALLLAVIYHTTSSGANENFELYNHIQRNVESFLSLHPDGLIYVTGDFNPVSTLFDEKRLKRLSGLTQIIKVPTRHNAILDWCLTNAKKVVFDVSQLPPIRSSDHNAILIKPHKDRLENSCNKRVCKRDLRDSSIRHFGQTITSTDWTEIFEIPDPNLNTGDLMK